MPIYRGIIWETCMKYGQSMNSCGGPRININHKICQPIFGASCWCLENLVPKRRSLHLLWRIRKELRSAGWLSLRHLLFKTHWNVETGWKAIRNLQKSFGKSQKMCTFSKQHGSRVFSHHVSSSNCWPRKKIRQILESSFRNSEAPPKTCFFFELKVCNLVLVPEPTTGTRKWMLDFRRFKNLISIFQIFFLFLNPFQDVQLLFFAFSGVIPESLFSWSSDPTLRPSRRHGWLFWQGSDGVHSALEYSHQSFRNRTSERCAAVPVLSVPQNNEPVRHSFSDILVWREWYLDLVENCFLK